MLIKAVKCVKKVITHLVLVSPFISFSISDIGGGGDPSPGADL